MDAPLDLLVLGSGVAGLSAAVRAAERPLRVGVMTKGELDQATTRWAQGGVAAVLGGTPDSTDLHFADTMAAGAGLCDSDAVRVLVDEGPVRVKELIDLGAAFDRDANGDLELAREGGHSRARVVHAGGAATGLEVERALVEAVKERVSALYEGWFACDLLVENGRCVGVTALPPGDVATRSTPDAVPEPVEVRARHVLIATGGAGQLFAVTTNPDEATGDGIAMGLRAGAAVADLEFVQFHPTALHHPVRPRPLLSEALRGHGALLRDRQGERFVDELLPRDQVSRAISERLTGAGVDHLWLDATGLEHFAERFPSIAASLRSAGLDPASDWLPVAPAAHYTCGGLVADLDGATSLPGVWVAGEAACNGVHGANRLASNSLLDGMVFGARVVEAIEQGKDEAEPTGVMRAVLQPDEQATVLQRPSGGSPQASTPSLVDLLQRTMTQDAGVVRSEDSLAHASSVIDGLLPDDMVSRVRGRAVTGARSARRDRTQDWELANLATVGQTVCLAALCRQETRGAHTRSDHPEPSPAFQRRLLVL
jgi:L-aspartate oxidase